MFIERSLESGQLTIHDFDLRLDRLKAGLLIHPTFKPDMTIDCCAVTTVEKHVPTSTRLYSRASLHSVDEAIREQPGFLLAVNGLAGVYAALLSVPNEILFSVLRDARKADRLIDFELVRMALGYGGHQWTNLEDIAKGLSLQMRASWDSPQQEALIVADAYLRIVQLLQEIPGREIALVGGRYDPTMPRVASSLDSRSRFEFESDETTATATLYPPSSANGA